MDIFPEILISASGLTAERARMNVIANNIANVNTTKTADGSVFRRQLTELMSIDAASSENGIPGVKVAGVVQDPSPLKMIYDPRHPDANQEGFVAKPNVDLMMEMVDLMSATRAYEANVTALQSAKEMAKSILNV